MSPELEGKLADAYPSLFRDLRGDPARTCMARGIECGDGWYEVVLDLCRNLQAQINRELYLKDVHFAQIKEKFGQLRVSLNYGMDFPHEKRFGRDSEDINKLLYRLSAITSYAELVSGHVCEDCGTRQDVEIKGAYWLAALCPPCRLKSEEMPNADYRHGS